MKNKQIDEINSAIELLKNINKVLAYSQGYITGVIQSLDNEIVAKQLNLGDFEQCENM